MDKKEITKAIIEAVVSVGVGTIVGNAIKTTTPCGLGVFKKVCVAVGSLVLGGLASDKASEYATTKFDEYASKVEELLVEKKETVGETE